MALALMLAASGCLPQRPVSVDEEKEPQFLIGRSRVNAMDFVGAIEAFEQALAMNPRSAAAHLELGWLHAEKVSDPAAAIYHYQKFLQLRPSADNAETIRQHVFRLKQELAKAALPIPPSSEMQRQLERLAEENRRLEDEVDRLRQLASQAGATNRNGPITRALPPSTNVPNVAINRQQRPNLNRTVNPTSPLIADRTHRIQAGDTLATVARRYNISLESLMAANPNLNPRRMQVGQIITLPKR